MIRRTLHAALAAAGVVLWLALAAGAVLLVGLAVLGHRIWPEAHRGNCWTWALPRWAAGGGDLAIRMVRVGRLPVPHVAWIAPDGVTHETQPVHRAQTGWQAWGGLATLYFRFRVRRRDVGKGHGQ